MGGVPMVRTTVRPVYLGGRTPVGGSPLVHPATAQPMKKFQITTVASEGETK